MNKLTIWENLRNEHPDFDDECCPCGEEFCDCAAEAEAFHYGE